MEDYCKWATVSEKQQNMYSNIGQQYYNSTLEKTKETSKDVEKRLRKKGFEFVGRGVGRVVFKIPKSMEPNLLVEKDIDWVIKFPMYNSKNIDGREQIMSEQQVLEDHSEILDKYLPCVPSIDENGWHIVMPYGETPDKDYINFKLAVNELINAGYKREEIERNVNWAIINNELKLIDFGMKI